MRAPDRLATRLSVSFVLLFVLTFSGVVAATLYYAQRTFQTSIDDSLAGEAQTADARLSEPDPDPNHAQTVIDELGSAAQFITLFDAEGRVLRRSSSTPNSLQTQAGAALRAPLTQVTTFRTVKAGKSRLRTVRYPLIRDGSVSGYVVVASPIPEVDEAIQSLAVLVIIAGLVGMSVAVVGTVWLSVREARPLRDLTEDVEATAASGFELEIPRLQEGSLESRQLREAFANLVEKQREVISRERAFFADSSHVLRTPLAVLQGDLEQLEQGVYGKERQEVVAQARNSLGTMVRAVNGLLLLAREHEQSPGSTWEVVELGDLLTRLVAEAQVAAPELKLGADLAPGMEMAGDPHQLRELFASLIENACHYTPEGGSVEVVMRPDESEDVVVEIRDTGIGLSVDDSAHATERFYRGAAARRIFPAGSGLGLAIAERIAKLHGGELELVSRTQGGTVARVKLPRLA